LEGRSLANKGKYSPYPGDVVDAKLEPGEYVLNRNAVSAIGEDNLNRLNNEIAPRFQNGGMNYGPFKSKRHYEENQRMQQKKAGIDSNIARLRALKIKQMEKERASQPAPGLRMPKEEPWKLSPAQRTTTTPPRQNPGSYNEIAQYARMKADPEHRRKMLSKMESPTTLRKAEMTPIDLQAIEVPTGDMFKVDEFNSMMGTAKIMNDYMINQGMVDSQNRSPFHIDYGKMPGLDPKTWKMPTDGRQLTPAEQLMAQMNMDRNKKFNTHIDENNPAIKQIFKDNPLMESLRQDKAWALQKWSDDRTQKLKDEIASEYSPYAMHNADIQKELIGDPDDPSDDYGSSMADAIKRGKERDELYWQNHDIKMMNPGGSPAFLMKDRSDKTGEKYIRTHDAEEYKKYRQEGARLHNERMKDEIISKDGLRMGSKSKKLKEEAEWKNIKKAKVPTIKQPELKGLDKLRKWSKDRGNKWSKAKAMRGKEYDKYLQQGGMVGPDGKRRYNIGAFVKGLGTSGMQGAQSAYSGLMGLINKGEQGVTALGEGIANRYGGQQYKDSVAKQKSMGIQGELNKDVFDDRDMGDASVADELQESNIEMAKMMRDDFGMGDQYVDKEVARNEAIMGGTSQVGQDLVTGAKALGTGALGVGAVTLGAGIEGAKGAYGLAKKGGEALYEGGKSLLEHGFDKENEGGLLADASHHLNKGAAAKYGDVWSGKEKGSLMQRGRKGLGGLGMLLQDASQAQGFQGADWKGSGLGRYSGPNTKDANDEAKKQTGIDNGSGDGQVLDLENAGTPTPTQEVLGDDPIKEMQLNTDSSDQRQVGTGVILNENNMVPTEASTSGGNTNIFNSNKPPEIASEEEMPSWMRKMTDPNYEEPVPAGIAAPQYDTNAPAPQFNVDDLTKINIGGGQTGGRVSLEGFIQQSWRNMR